MKELTGGAGVSAVFDGVGKRTFDASLACLATRGMLALFGQSSGVVPPFDPAVLARASLFLARPVLGHYVAARDELVSRRDAAVRGRGQRGGEGRRRRRLRAVGRGRGARDLEARKTTGIDAAAFPRTCP